MKKQRKQFLFITIVLVFLIAATAGMKLYNKNAETAKEKEAAADTIYITQTAAEDIMAFSYELNGETLSFTKQDGTWSYDQDPSANLDQDAVESLLSVFSSFTATDEITAYEDLSEYALDAPADTVTFTTDAGTVTLYEGMENAMLNEYYVKNADSDVVYLTATSLQTRLSKSVEDLTVLEETETAE